MTKFYALSLISKIVSNLNCTSGCSGDLRLTNYAICIGKWSRNSADTDAGLYAIKFSFSSLLTSTSVTTQSLMLHDATFTFTSYDLEGLIFLDKDKMHIYAVESQ